MASTAFTLFGCPQESPASAPSTAPTETSKAPDQNPEKNPEKSEIPTRVAIRHIVLAYHGAQGAPLGTNRTREEAQEAAQSLRERILAGEEMAELAKRYSSDGTRARGGFLVWRKYRQHLFQEIGGCGMKPQVPEHLPLLNYHLVMQ